MKDKSTNRDRAPLVLFVFALVFAAFVYGFFTGFAGIPPYRTIISTYQELRDFSKYWQNDLKIEPTRLLVP